VYSISAEPIETSAYTAILSGAIPVNWAPPYASAMLRRARVYAPVPDLLSEPASTRGPKKLCSRPGAAVSVRCPSAWSEASAYLLDTAVSVRCHDTAVSGQPEPPGYLRQAVLGRVCI